MRRILYLLLIVSILLTAFAVTAMAGTDDEGGACGTDDRSECEDGPGHESDDDGPGACGTDDYKECRHSG